MVSDRTGKMYAATLSDGVFASDEHGKTWDSSSL